MTSLISDLEPKSKPGSGKRPARKTLASHQSDTHIRRYETYELHMMLEPLDAPEAKWVLFIRLGDGEEKARVIVSQADASMIADLHDVPNMRAYAFTKIEGRERDTIRLSNLLKPSSRLGRMISKVIEKRFHVAYTSKLEDALAHDFQDHIWIYNLQHKIDNDRWHSRWVGQTEPLWSELTDPIEMCIIPAEESAAQGEDAVEQLRAAAQSVSAAGARPAWIQLNIKIDADDPRLPKLIALLGETP